MKLACDKIETQDEPINHIIVLIGDAMKANGSATINRPVYNWELENLPIGVTKSSPPSLLMANTPPPTKAITNNNNKLVISAYKDKDKTIAT